MDLHWWIHFCSVLLVASLNNIGVLTFGPLIVQTGRSFTVVRQSQNYQFYPNLFNYFYNMKLMSLKNLFRVVTYILKNKNEFFSIKFSHIWLKNIQHNLLLSNVTKNSNLHWKSWFISTIGRLLKKYVFPKKYISQKQRHKINF